ncbi:MAG: MATE family efflux transporter [Spirochaetaceae bacterium]|jgi:putative MATE family efflux protein|nr:MATE family efflux transporter [Spirochaetaceae bacterium]
MTKNLTHGNPLLTILAFSLPLIVGNLFQQFYSMADTYIVGNTIGMQALAAVGCTGSINFLVIGFIFGFSTGASILTSQQYGANDLAGVRRSFAAGIVLAVIVTIVLMIVSITCSGFLLRFLNTPPDLFDDAYRYIIIIFAGMPAITLFNLVSNAMRAVGDSTTPLIFLVVACIINIVLDYVFILVFHTGVEGAAYATVIAQLLSGLACIPVITKKLTVLKLQKKDWPTGKEIVVHAKIALPVGFQMSIIAIGAVAVTYALNNIGTTAVAAFTTSQKIDMIASMPINSLGLAMTTYAAQNFGAKKYARIIKGVTEAAAVSVGFSALMAVIYFFFGNHLAALFLGNEAEAIALSHTYLKINGVCYPLLAWLFISRYSLQGLGDTVVATLAGILELVGRTAAAILLGAVWGFAGISFSSPLAWALALIPLTTAAVLKMKKLRRMEIAHKKEQHYRET